MRSIFNEGVRDDRVKTYLMPKKIVWQNGNIEKAEQLLVERPVQSRLYVDEMTTCVMNEGSSVILDFGMEIHGGIAVVVSKCDCGKPQEGKLNIRFGESVMECMTPVGGPKNATNHHAQRDFELPVSFYGMTEFGNSGYRFVRIDCPKGYVQLTSVRATFIFQDIEYKGSFECDDKMLNDIWDTAVYTVHLNMQNYIWDGIKRDRLVWIGDMHPETSTVQRVFGFNQCVPNSLDLTRDCFPADMWMNNIPSYTMWWIKIHWDWYMQNGELSYLKEQKDYLYKALEHLFSVIHEDGTVDITDNFIDWPTSTDQVGARSGMFAVFIMALDAAANICQEYGDAEKSAECKKYAEILKKNSPHPGKCKQAAALQALAGVLDCKKVNEEILSVDPFRNLSTFLGYYILKVRGEAGDIDGTIDLMNTFWGKMIELGGTTFFEDFNLDWAENAYRIDEFVPEDGNDIHGDHGDYCYKGFRHSLCHGWASGPAAYMQEYILGVKVLKPGCKLVSVKPNLGKLNYVRGTYPTPYGNIKISAEKVNGEVKVTVEKPDEVEIAE